MSRRLIGNAEVLAEMLQDPEFRAEWERTALARAVAEAVIRYRAEHGLSQTALAGMLGWRQPVVARLEAAEHNPRWIPCSPWRARSACGFMWMWARGPGSSPRSPSPGPPDHGSLSAELARTVAVEEVTRDRRIRRSEPFRKVMGGSL